VHRSIEEALDACRSEIGRKKIELTTDFRAARHVVNADATKLQQIIWNLLKNAVKFSNDGGAISIRSKNIEDDRIAVQVTDNGIGIEAELLRRIFTPFEQGNARSVAAMGDWVWDSRSPRRSPRPTAAR
jgi:signal transduction histidine kinase